MWAWACPVTRSCSVTRPSETPPPFASSPRVCRSCAACCHGAAGRRCCCLKRRTGRYLGTKNYHNLTRGKTASDASSKRFIREITASEPFLVDGVEFVRVLLHGQSFLLYQIRKMVGLVVAEMRGVVPKGTIQQGKAAADPPLLTRRHQL